MSQLGIRELGTEMSIQDMYVQRNDEVEADWPPVCPECRQPLHGRWLPRDHSHEWRFKCFPCNGLWWKDELPVVPLGEDEYAFLTYGKERKATRIQASRAFSRRPVVYGWTSVKERGAA